jgi:glycine betaine/proline transport system substrate-binding protein
MQAVAIGHLHLPSGEITAALVQCVLERLGHRVRLVEATATDLLDGMRSGDVHLVSSAVLQVAEDAWEPPRPTLVEVAALADGQRFLWSVPDDGRLRRVCSMGDLAGADIRGEILVVAGGAGGRLSRAALRAYGLDAHGFRVREEVWGHWSALCRDAAADPEGFVVAHPSHHILPEGCGFRPLADPLCALGQEFRIGFVALPAVADALPTRTVETLRRVRPGAEALIALEADMRRQHAAPRALVRAWLDAHPQVWAEWMQAEMLPAIA